MPRVEVVRTHVELALRSDLRPAPRPDPRARVERVQGCPASFFRYLYAEVGRGHFWLERVRWSDFDPTVARTLIAAADAPPWEANGTLDEMRAFVRALETGSGWWPDLREATWSSRAAAAIQTCHDGPLPLD